MARILIKSLFMYPGALWSLSGALVCSSTAALLVCVAMASLTQTAVPPSHSHGQHDEWRRTCCWIHPLWEQLRNRSIPQGRKTSMTNQQERVSSGYVFQAQPPTLDQPVAPLHNTVHEAVSWPRPIPLNWCPQRGSWCIIPPVMLFKVYVSDRTCSQIAETVEIPQEAKGGMGSNWSNLQGK